MDMSVSFLIPICIYSTKEEEGVMCLLGKEETLL